MSKTSKNKKPPKIAEYLISRMFPDDNYYTTVSDLEEDYKYLLSRKGKTYAGIWYWLQIVPASVHFGFNKLKWSFVMFTNYIKIALRNLIKHKGFSFINIFGMAAGLSCSLLIFLYVVDEVKFDSIHKNKDNIYRAIYVERSGSNENHIGFVQAPLGPALKNDFPEVKEFVRFITAGRISIRSGDQFIHEGKYFFADPSVFDVFDFSFYKGSKESAFKFPNSVVLTKKGAVRFLGKEDVLGEVLEIDRLGQMKVTAVLEDIPENSHLHFDILLPMNILLRKPEESNNWQRLGFITYILLDEKSSYEQLNIKLTGLYDRVRTGNKDSRNTIYLQPMNEIHYESENILFESNHNKGNIQYVYILSALGLVILFIACFNFMNLSVARSSLRSKEIGVRKVVGAHKKQLMFQMINESILLTVFSFGTGLIFAKFLLPVFNGLSDKNLELSQFVSPDIIIILLIMVPGIGIFSGFYPSFILTAFKPVNILRGEKGHKNRRALIREGLVILQISMTIVMIVMTLTANKQMDFIRNKNLGFKKEQIVTLEINTGNIRAKWSTMREQLLSVPGVKTVSISSKVPFGRQSINGIPVRIERAGELQEVEANIFTIDDNFLDTYKIELSSGRNVSKQYGTYEQSILINESAAGMFGWSEPVGEKVYINQFETQYTVTGVVKDFHYQSLHQLIAPLIMPVRDQSMDYISMRLDTGSLSATLDKINNVHKQFDKNIAEFAFVDQTFENLYNTDRKMGTIFKYSAILSILISFLGLFGLSAFVIEQRSRELSIRKILGASGVTIFKIVSMDYLKSAVAANILAWPVAFYAINKWLNNFAYKAETGMSIFIVSGLISLAIIVLTVSYKSITAAIANPVDSLRNE